MEALGHQGLNDMLAGFTDKSAQAVCTFAYCEGPGHEPIIFQGRTDVRTPVFYLLSSISQLLGQDSTSERATKFW